MKTMSISRQQRRVMQSRAEAVDRVVDGDRRFFERHPDRTYLIRLLSHVERAQAATLQVPTGGRPGAPVAFAAIKQLAPGTRLRFVVYGPAAAIGEDLTDAEARAVWEGFADAHPWVRKHEADMLAAMRRPGGPLHEKGPCP